MKMIQAEIIQIGQEAISPKDQMMILFGEHVTPQLAEVSVIQKFSEKPVFALKKGDELKIGKRTYSITQVGELVNEHLTKLGHATLMFKEAPQNDEMKNNIYLEPHDFPTIQVGDSLTYVMDGGENE